MLSAETRKHLFDNGEDNLFKLIEGHKDGDFLEELSLLVCGVKIEDFKEDTSEMFISKLKSIKNTIEYYPKTAEKDDNLYEILCIKDGKKSMRNISESKLNADVNYLATFSEFIKAIQKDIYESDICIKSSD